MEKIIISLMIGIMIGASSIFVFNSLTGRIVCLERYLIYGLDMDGNLWCDGNKSIIITN